MSCEEERSGGRDEGRGGGSKWVLGFGCSFSSLDILPTAPATQTTTDGMYISC